MCHSAIDDVSEADELGDKHPFQKSTYLLRCSIVSPVMTASPFLLKAPVAADHYLDGGIGITTLTRVRWTSHSPSKEREQYLICTGRAADLRRS